MHRSLRPVIARIPVLAFVFALIVSLLGGTLTASPAVAAPAPTTQSVVQTAQAAQSTAFALTGCLYKPPAVVPWGADYVTFCRTPSGSWKARPNVGQDTFVTYSGRKVGSTWYWYAAPHVGQLIGQVNITTSTGARVTRNMSVKYNQSVTDYPPVDPDIPTTVIKYTVPDGAKLNWVDIMPSPFKLTASDKYTGVWTKISNRKWTSKKMNPAVVAKGLVPDRTAKLVNGRYCKVLVAYNYTDRYIKSAGAVRHYNANGKLDTTALVRSGGWLKAAVEVGCHNSPSAALAQIQAAMIRIPA